MATKAKGKTEAAPAEAPAGGGSKKKMIVIILAAVMASGAAAGGAVWFLGRNKAPAAVEEKKAASGPAIFLPLDPFTVNLVSEDTDKYLQVTVHLQVADAPTVELLKPNIAIVRNRILILLSSKKASEINSVEGKERLAEEIVEEMKRPFVPKGKEQEVLGALFTAFIIQ